MSLARFSPRAEQDLDDIHSYIASNNPEAAARVRQRILATADFLAQHPEAGRRILRAGPRHAQVRWLVVPRYRNYLIFYQPLGETIVVVRVLHAARDWTKFF
jgi:plasmid stabilization system protein ParE